MAAHRAASAEPDLTQLVDELRTVLPWLLLLAMTLIAAVTA